MHPTSAANFGLAHTRSGRLQKAQKIPLMLLRIAGFLVAAPLLALVTVLACDADGGSLLLAFGPALHPAFSFVVQAAQAFLMRRCEVKAKTMARVSRGSVERRGALTSTLLVTSGPALH